MGAAAVVAGVLAQLQELLHVDMPGLQIGADGTLALAPVVGQGGGGHVSFVALYLEVVDLGYGPDRGNGFDPGENTVTEAEPVVLGQWRHAHQAGDLGCSRDTEVEGAGSAGEGHHGAVAPGALMGVVPLPVLPGAGDAETQELIAQALGQGSGNGGKVDFLAARAPPVGLQQALDQGQGPVMG